MGGAALRWIRANDSRIIAANAGRQSSNGLVERTWRTIVQMARAYITEKQVLRNPPRGQHDQPSAWSPWPQTLHPF